MIWNFCIRRPVLTLVIFLIIGTVVQAVVADEAVENLMAALGAFRAEKPAHEHLEALILPLERRL